MLNLTRPLYVIPVHGEYRHLELWRRMFLARDVSLAARPELAPSAGPVEPTRVAGQDPVSVRA